MSTAGWWARCPCWRIPLPDSVQRCTLHTARRLERAWDLSLGSPPASPGAAPSTALSSSKDVATDDLLAGFDEIVAGVAERDHEEAERSEEELEERTAFLTAFQEACQSQARPAMEVVLERLTAHGGGGVIEEHPGGEPRFRHPSLILWMSLEGGIVGEPRADREPYLQLEANVAGRRHRGILKGTCGAVRAEDAADLWESGSFPN